MKPNMQQVYSMRRLWENYRSDCFEMAEREWREENSLVKRLCTKNNLPQITEKQHKIFQDMLSPTELEIYKHIRSSL